MYKKIRDAFFNEFLKEGLGELPENFYPDAKKYIETIDDNFKLERTKYYLMELLNIRYYKINCLKESPNNTTKDEKKLLKFIEDILFGRLDIEDIYKKEDIDKKKKFKNQLNLDTGHENEGACQKPKPINTESDIDIVRVITKFPCFTDGNLQYILNKNDIISLDRKFSKILEKHNVVKRVNVHEDEKKDKKVLSIL
jgi:DNA replication initiation complex subunit (GINS family)